MRAVKALDRVFFWVIRICYSARDFVAYRSHPHIPARSSMTAATRGAWIECCECWCGCRCTVTLTGGSELPVQLPRSAEWQIPPVEGWPAELDRRLDWRRNL